MPKMYKKGEVLKISKTQSGKQSNTAMDKEIEAMFPGKRMSKSGKIYWETRKNRSDINPKSGL
tara:strand:+ start:207 stop:395 length:189 start_codon:yes stop_codon:yes gene_type:complete